MDATRLGITFQEAQAVLRNIRTRYSDPRSQSRNDREIKKEPSFSSHKESPYFISNAFIKSQCSTSSVNCEMSTKAERKYCPQKPDPKRSSIAKRLEEFKQSTNIATNSRREQYTDSKITPLARKSMNSNASRFSESRSLKMVPSNIEHSVFKPSTSTLQKKDEVPKELSKTSNATYTGRQMSITSYMPKVKNPNNAVKINVKRQTAIEEFSPRKSEKVFAQSIESMSLEERELVKKTIFAANNVACTLVYVDGSSLLRPSAAKNPVKTVFFSFSEHVICSLENCCSFLFPLPSLDENIHHEYYQWLREFFLKFMAIESNKVVYNAQRFIKTLINVLNITDYTVGFQWRCFDPQIASWLLDPDHPPENFDTLLRKGFREEKKSDEESDKNMNDQVHEDMFSLLSLMPDMFLALQEKHLWELFSELEMRISPILAVMEFVGVEVDTKLLLDYGNILERKVKKLEQEGYKSVGHPFQLSSTQQLRQVLFNELELDKNVQKRLARTQIKNYKSTSENVLKHLQDFHPLPKIILEYRSVTKVKSAYVEGILHFVENGVLHTNWNQTCTATGRLTSTNPNIQAIPKNQLDITGVVKQFIIGKEMETTSIIPRKAFKSRTGWSFVSSDFQSIELRLLAHFSEDPLLLRIFNESENDIFVQLASIWLSVDPESVQSEDRERAKRVVYSVVYGVGKERLADTLNVSADEAKSFTTSFLATFPGLKRFIQSCINECRKQGYVTTIFGRRRLLPAINSSDAQLRAQSERQAVNFVIQGSAADICKIGMILVVRSLSQDLKLKARLLIQIHDELVLEAQDDHVQSVTELVKACLEDTDALCGSHVKLKVNLKVSISCGKTWAEMQAI